MKSTKLGDKTILSDVLIKKVRGGYPDEAMYIDNLPWELVFEMQHPKVVMGEGRAAYWGTDVTKPKVETLKDGIDKSQNDDALVFDVDRNEGKDRLDDIMRYVEAMWPREKSLPKFTHTAMQPADSRSPARAYNQISRAELPLLSPPGNSPENGSQSGTLQGLDLSQIKDSIKAEILKDQEDAKREAARERAAKARAAKKDKAEAVQE